MNAPRQGIASPILMLKHSIEVLIVFFRMLFYRNMKLHPDIKSYHVTGMNPQHEAATIMFLVIFPPHILKHFEHSPAFFFMLTYVYVYMSPSFLVAIYRSLYGCCNYIFILFSCKTLCISFACVVLYEKNGFACLSITVYCVFFKKGQVWGDIKDSPLNRVKYGS